jgi:hypothetical protein
MTFDLVRLAAGHVEGERPALGVGAQMDLGQESAARPEGFLPRLRLNLKL